MGKAELNSAKQAIGTILRQLVVTQVVYVDDVFDDTQDVAKVIGWLGEAYSKSPAEASALIPGLPLDGPDQVWPQELRSRWDKLDTSERREILIRLSVMRGSELAADRKAASQMRGMFPRRVRFTELSPSQWEAQRDAILQGASAQARLLCLFDQNLSEAPGFTSSGSKSGIGLIQEVVGREISEGVVCGLVSHTIHSLEDEIVEWRRLAEETRLGLNQFLPLAKIRLSDDADPRLFADGIKKMVLNSFCEELKASAIAILGAAHNDALEKLKMLDVYDFDYMILQASFSEGEWEADTLMRVFRIFQQDVVCQLMATPELSASFTRNAEIARSVSEVATTGSEAGYPWNVRCIRQSELYEEAALIRHSPLRLGDVFESRLGDGTTLPFILLAQPCDLMVRHDGQRDIGGDLLVPLAPVVDRISYLDADAKQHTYLRKHAFLPYFYNDSTDVAVVAFADAHLVRAEILDLAVLDDQGRCRLDPNAENPIPPNLTVGWKSHLRNLRDTLAEQKRKLDGFHTSILVIADEAARMALWRSVMPTIFVKSIGLGSEIYSNGVFDYGLSRTRRLRQPRAERLLKAYTQYLSRDADEADFARPRQPNA